MNRVTTSIFAAASAALLGSAAAAWAQDEQRIHLASARDVIGMDIETNDGRDAGEIEYLLIEPLSGRIRYALISEDDDLELADDQLIALPFSTLNLREADSDEIEADVSFAQLNGAPKIAGDSLDEFTKPVVITRIYDYYQTPEEDQIPANSKADGQPGKESQAAAAQKSDAAQTTPESADEQGQPHLMVTRTAVTTIIPGMARADRIIGADVRALSGDEELGEIGELVLDATHGKVAYVLVGQGGFLGIGEEWAAFPLQELVWNAEEEVYVSDAEKAGNKFRNLPKSSLPTSVPKSQLDEFYRAFGLEAHTSS